MTEELKILADGILEKCNQLADMLEDMVDMVENDDESLEDSDIDIQQISDCLEDVYGIRELFDGIGDLTIDRIHAMATDENPIVKDDELEIVFADGTTYRKFGYNDKARKKICLA